jgi:hypothetical protein
LAALFLCQRFDDIRAMSNPPGCFIFRIPELHRNAAGSSRSCVIVDRASRTVLAGRTAVCRLLNSIDKVNTKPSSPSKARTVDRAIFAELDLQT